MRILFIGTVDFSFSLLDKLFDLNANIAGVITKETSEINSDYKDLAPLCKSHKTPFIYTTDINDKKTLDWIKSIHPDIIFCFGWSSLLKEELLNITPMGVIGYHPAALPKNRGRHPIIWPLVLGLNETASTFFFMDNGADSGDIISQSFVEISDNDDARSLYGKLKQAALLQIETMLPKLSDNSIDRIKQGHDAATYWRKRTKKDGIIDFRMSTYAIYNLIRALTKPYPGAEIEYHNRSIKIWRSEIFNTPVPNNIEPGRVINHLENHKFTVKTYDGAITLIEHEFITLPPIGSYL